MGLRNYLSYLRFCFRFHRLNFLSLCINGGILIYLILTFRMSIDNLSDYGLTIVSCVSVVFNLGWAFVSFLIDVVPLFKPISARLERNTRKYSSFKISPKEKQLGYHFIVHKQTALTSEHINALLIEGEECGAYINRRKQRMQRTMYKKMFDQLQPFLKCKLQESMHIGFYNQTLLCLSDDVMPHKANGFYKGDYYESYLTNLSFSWALRTNEGRLVLPPLAEEYINELPDLTCSNMNNSIGVNTIAFTKDGYIFCLQQNARANASAGEYTPSGSGVANWSDYIPGQFFASILHATNRELFEECGFHRCITKKIPVIHSKVIGFYRWMDNGGKPEFVSISAINMSISDINPQKKEQTRSIISHYILSNDSTIIDTQAIEGFAIAQQRHSLCSFSLYMSLQIMRTYIRLNNKEFQQTLSCWIKDFAV